MLTLFFVLPQMDNRAKLGHSSQRNVGPISAQNGAESPRGSILPVQRDLGTSPHLPL